MAQNSLDHHSFYPSTIVTQVQPISDSISLIPPPTYDQLITREHKEEINTFQGDKITLAKEYREFANDDSNHNRQEHSYSTKIINPKIKNLPESSMRRARGGHDEVRLSKT